MRGRLALCLSAGGRFLLCVLLLWALSPIILPDTVKKAEATTTKIVNGDFSYGMSTLYNCSGCTWRYFNPDILATTGPVCPVHTTSASLWSDLPANFKVSDFGWRSNQTVNGRNPDGGADVRPGTVEIQREVNGNWFAELTADQAGTAIYQDIDTDPGAIYKWSLKHCSRCNTNVDSMSVMIGTPASQNAQVATRTSVNGLGNKLGPVGTVFSTPSDFAPANDNSTQQRVKWESYTGTYAVPAGQTKTRFTFLAVNSASPNAGNLVDDISFTRSYALNYDLMGGSATDIYTDASANNYAGYRVEGNSVALSTSIPTRDGFKFLGWSRTKIDDITDLDSYNTAKSNLISSFTMPSQATTVYAVWAKNPQVIFTDGNGAQLNSQTVDFGNGASAPDLPSRTGYTLIGWDRPFSNVYSDTTINACWSANRYTITFDANGGSGSMLDQKLLFEEEQQLNENAFTRAGFRWLNWDTNRYLSEQRFADNETVQNLSEHANEVVTLYAIWAANRCLVTFDPNGGEGRMEAQSLAYDTPEELNANAFTRKGYAWTSWNTQPDGTGDSFFDEQNVQNLIERDNATVTLYAQWEPEDKTLDSPEENASGDTSNASSSAANLNPSSEDTDDLQKSEATLPDASQGNSFQNDASQSNSIHNNSEKCEETVEPNASLKLGTENYADDDTLGSEELGEETSGIDSNAGRSDDSDPSVQAKEGPKFSYDKTGSDIFPFVCAAAILITIGVLLIVVSARRHKQELERKRKFYRSILKL